MKKKVNVQDNLIIIHFESLNLDIFYNNREFFPNLYDLISKSRFYTKAYSSSTSTLMVLADILYMDMSIFESAKSIYDIRNIEHEKNFLEKMGGKKDFVFYPEWKSEDKECLEGIFNSKVIFSKDYDDFIGNIKEKIIAKKNFILFIYCGMSGISFLHYSDEISWNNRWKNGYMKSDEIVGMIWRTLEDRGLLEKTKLIVYGDHGDDFWCHGFNNGYCHGIEPYSNMIHVPLIVYGNSISPAISNDLISLPDIGKLILEDDFDKLKDTTIFARNTYYNQRQEELELVKSYALTDGEYFLLYSVRGYEFYYLPYDSKCEKNLLDFFLLSNDNTYSLNPYFAKSKNKHLKKALPKYRQIEILNAFLYFKSKLIQKISENNNIQL